MLYNLELCNPENSGTEVMQSRDFEIAKWVGISGFGSPVLQSLTENQRH
jgi:hypothetical protein